MTDAIDPKAVPFRTLKSGAKIPVVGLGTFGSDAVTGEQIAAAVLDAASVGYRHFDCASVYGNEHLIGPSLKKIVAGGVPREELWVTSKVWNDQHKEVEKACEKSLRDLQLDYLDLYLVHWPFPNFHPPGCAPDYHNPNAKPYLHDAYMATWAQMERLVERGLVRHIGTSNVTVPKLKLILRDARIKPAANEMELHPHFQQKELFEYVTGNEIVPIGYSPIGSPGRPERDRTPEDTVDTEDPVILHRGTAGRPSGRGLPQVGHPARRGGHSVFGQAPQLSREPGRGSERATHHAGDAGHRRDRPGLPADQGPGLSLERGPDVGSALGPRWRNHAAVVFSRL
jgi:diketogulonate reductase-like aldo/keto reductase